jgi:ATP-binding protein involved in chromosome partitioning
MGGSERCTPKDLNSFPNGEIGIVWEDGHESIYTGYYLRCNCNCAACVDEMSGVKILENESVPRAVMAREIHGVGRYGIAIAWSDGHDTGIFDYRYLRSLDPN